MATIHLELIVSIVGILLIALGTIINIRGMLLSREEVRRITSGSRDELTPAAIGGYILRLGHDSRIALPFIWVGIALQIIDLLDEYLNMY